MARINGRVIPFIEGLTSTEIRDIPIADIDRTDRRFQFRLSTRAGNIRASLIREGQREPIDLFGDAPHIVIDGGSRLEAMVSLGWTHVKAIVHRGISERDAERLAFTKNVVRKNLTSLDRANAIHLALKRGRTIPELAQELGYSEKQIARYVSLLHFPPPVQDLLEHEQISMAHAKVLSDFKVKDLAAWALRIREGLSAKQLKRALRMDAGVTPVGRKKLYLKRERSAVRFYPFSLCRGSSRREIEHVLALLVQVHDTIANWLEDPPASIAKRASTRTHPRAS